MMPKKFRRDPALRAALFEFTQLLCATHDRAEIAKGIGVQPNWELCDAIMVLALKAWAANMTAGCQLSHVSSEELDTVLAQLQSRIDVLERKDQ